MALSLGMGVADLVKNTFVFEEIAHSSAASEHELRHIFDDLGLVFRRQGDEPFGKSLGTLVSAGRER